MFKKKIMSLVLSLSDFGAVEAIRPAPATSTAFIDNTFSSIKSKKELNPAIVLCVVFLEGVCYTLPPLALVGLVGGVVANRSQNNNKEICKTND